MDTPVPRLYCLAAPRVESFGQAFALGPRQASDPIRLLLRVAGAGPRGIRVETLQAALWPGVPARERRGRFDDCLRCLALLLGTAEPPVRVCGDLARIDEGLLEVDSLALENALAPLLDAFQPPSGAQTEAARLRLGRALAGEIVFLPDVDEPWADAARHRIADAVARAARRIALPHSLPALP